MSLLIGDLLSSAAFAAPDGVAATLGERSMSYSELDRWANRFANRFEAFGVGRGDVIVWCSGPDLSSIAAFGGSARTGAVFASLNPALGGDELAAALDYLQPKLVVADTDRYEQARSVYGGSAAVVSTLGDSPAGLDECTAGLDECTAAATRDLPRSAEETDAHIVYLTSGTTGTPKGVLVSHRASWLRSFPGGSTFAAGLRGDGGILVSFPLFHYGGWHYVLEAWHHRCAFHICERFDGETIVEQAALWRPTGMYAIPAVWGRILDAADDGDLASVRHADTGTSAAAPELLDRLRERLPDATVSVHYGSSEGGHHTTLHHRNLDDKPGSVGRAAPPGLIATAPDGEVLYRSPTLMNGYLNRPRDTADALAGGWYHTGDLGVVDDEGYLYITGRKKELIRTAGEFVSPAEVESALRGMPGVSDLAVVGLPDTQWGEIVCVAVVPAPGTAAIDEPAVRDYLRDRLAPFKHPRRLVALERIPRTPATGQVQRTLVRDEAIARLEGTLQGP